MSLVDGHDQKAWRVAEWLRSAQAPAARKRLLDVVEDAARSQDERVAAARALARDLDAPSRVRLRVAAASFARPKVRIALEKAADASDEEEIEAALAALEPAESHPAGRSIRTP